MAWKSCCLQLSIMHILRIWAEWSYVNWWYVTHLSFDRVPIIVLFPLTPLTQSVCISLWILLFQALIKMCLSVHSVSNILGISYSIASIGSGGNPECVKSRMNVCWTWAWPCWGLQGSDPWDNWQSQFLLWVRLKRGNKSSPWESECYEQLASVCKDEQWQFPPPGSL